MAGERITGKQKAARIALDYYKKPDKVQRTKLLLTWIALAVTIVWWVGRSVVGSDGGRALYSRGPVAAVHAAWDTECATCHETLKPISNSASAAQLVGLHPSQDQLCQKCHSGAAHASRQIASEVHSCGTCHRDHQGRDASLVRLADSDCTRCHANLDNHIDKAKKAPEGAPFEAKVTVFGDKTHPEFRANKEFEAKKQRPDHLRFSHKVHMRPGMALEGGKQTIREGVGIPFTLKQVSPEWRERYRKQGQTDDALVELTCASCHVLDSAEYKMNASQITDLPSALVLPPRASGGYMLPIVYENQCKGCHPLSLNKPSKDEPALTITHGLQTAQVHDALNGIFMERFVRGKSPELLEMLKRPFSLRPGQAPPKDEATTKVAEEMTKWVQDREKILFVGNQTCGECHNYRDKKGAQLKNDTLLSTLMKGDSAPEFDIMPPGIPTIWNKFARFNHTSHRAVDCRECHEGAYADKAQTTVDGLDKEILVPGIANCVQCHAPIGKNSTGQRVGGVRFECGECHKYHNGDAPLQGPGAIILAPKQPMKLSEFLSGTGPEKR
jgi:hypothetical protein